VILWKLDLQLPVKSVPITTKVVSLNPTHCNVYLIQHYVIKLVGDRSLVHRFSQSRKLTSQNNLNIVESGVEHHNQEFYTTIQYKQEFYTIIQYSQEFYTIIQYNQEFNTTIQYKLGILHSHTI
jgi:beta-xylosidase